MSDPLQSPPPPPPGPPPGPPPSPGRPGNAWDRREELGFGNALVEAIKGFVTDPTGTFAKTRESGDVVGPLIFAGVILALMSIVGQVWSAMFTTSMMAFFPEDVRSQMGAMPMGAAGGVGFVFGTIFAFFYYAVMLAIGVALTHLSALIVGALRNSTAGFEGTLRVVSFAMVGQLAGLVPILGGLIALVWTVILMVIGVVELHRTSTGTAVLAVLLPIVVCCVCIGGVFVLAFGGIMAAAGAGG